MYTLREEVKASLWQEQLVMVLCAFFAISALLLCGVGIYSALSYSVDRRSRELGIRMALGAQVKDIVQTVAARLTIALAFGTCGGLLLSVLLLKFLTSFLFQVSPLDIPSYLVAAVMILFCSLAAVSVPAWRAIRVEPSVTLRQE